MGGIFAKLDNQDKVISLEKKITNPLVKDESTLNLDLLRDYINKYGYIRVEMDLKQLEIYVNSFGTKYFNKNINEVKNIYGGMGMGFGILSMMLSSFGLIVLSEKQIENFHDVIGHEQNDYNIYESFSNVGNKLAQQTQQEKQAQLSKIQIVGKPIPVPQAEQPIPVPQAEQPQQYIILLPKIYFTSDRNTFIDFLIASLPKSGTNLQQNKNIYTLVKTIMDKINLTPNPEVKIVNTIGLLIRMSLLMTFLDLYKTQESKYSDDEKMAIISGIISDNLEDIPYDDCVFYNDKINFIKFTPNICQKAKEEKELNLKKKYETKCPVQEQVICPVQEQVKCPVQEQVICPVLEQVKCPSCGDTKCPDRTCPSCSQPSNLWKYISALLIIIVIVMVLIMIFKSSSKHGNIKNLAKLN